MIFKKGKISFILGIEEVGKEICMSTIFQCLHLPLAYLSNGCTHSWKHNSYAHILVSAINKKFRDYITLI